MRRGAALAVALLCVAPLHRLLSPERNGPGGADAVLRAEAAWSVTLWGTLLVGLVGLVGVLWARGREKWSRAGGGMERAADDGTAGSAEGGSLLQRLAGRGTLEVALLAAAVAGLLSALVALGVYDRLLVSVDEMAQLIHARYLASGRLAAPLPAGAEAWSIPNMLVTERGWVSQYPPGHVAAWAAFVLAGLGWAAGPLSFALMVGLLSASLDRLLPDAHRAHGRIAALLTAASPFAVSIAATGASHLSAGAAGMLALYGALRAGDGDRRGAARWAAVAGGAVGMMVLARPWTGLVLGPVLTLGVWLERRGAASSLRLVGPWILGGLPFALLLILYDDALFGSPLTLGYEALYGPAHGLGLHPDPWSYPYGLREALAYSASDVVQLGAALLEAPLSVVLLGAAYLVLARTLPRGVAVVAAWALLPVAANALYWFHAPRMLFEAAPAWMLLAVLAVAHARERSAPVWRSGIGAAVAAALLLAVPLAISRVVSLGWSDETLSRITVPAELRDGTASGTSADARAALVFVHAGWDERIASMLQAAGMRNDSIQPVLRRNDTCALHLYAVARLAGEGGSALPVDLAQTHRPPDLARPVVLEGGTRIWRAEGGAWPAVCAREAAADRFGTLALAPLLWQGDLPGLESGRPMFVRDQGPERNAAVRAAFSDRPALVLSYGAASGRPTLLPYDQAMATLWGQPPI